MKEIMLIGIGEVVQKSAYGDVNDDNNYRNEVGKNDIIKDSVDVDNDGEIETVVEMIILMKMVVWIMLIQGKVARYYLLLNISCWQRTVTNGI